MDAYYADRIFDLLGLILISNPFDLLIAKAWEAIILKSWKNHSFIVTILYLTGELAKAIREYLNLARCSINLAK